MIRWMLLATLLMQGILVAGALAQEITVWHDKGDDGLRMFDQLSVEYARIHPGVTIKSLSMPTDQWFSRSIAGLNTGTGPDVLFNDNARIVQVQLATGKLGDLQPALDTAPAADRAFLKPGDLASSTLRGRLIQVPFQRSLWAWGVRRSWMEHVGQSFPRTWDDMIRLGRAFQDGDVDGTGRKHFGIALQAGDASGITDAGISLFVFGNSLPHPLVDETGEVIIDRPEVARIVIDYLKLYTTQKLVSPDTVNHIFTDMYQLIEGGQAGMFRVGNGNVAKWDGPSLKGDYVVGPFPSVAGGTSAIVVGSIRGMAVPDNARHKDAARAFVAWILDKQAQQISLANMGGAIRSDLDTSGVTPSLRPFLAADAVLQNDDSASAVFPWYLKLRDAYYRMLIAAVNEPPADWDAWIKQTATKLRTEAAALKAKG